MHEQSGLLTTMVCFDGCFDRNEVPAVFSEPYIKGGYRAPYQPLHYYVRSLFFYHNELINMWTALLTLVAHLYLFNFCHQLDMLFMLNLAATLIHVYSFVAHTFSHHSAKMHVACYMLDFLGIYFGCSIVMPTFLVYHLHISLPSALVYALAVLLWHTVVFRNCCSMFYLCWQPWLTALNDGMTHLAKPRVLTFVIKSVWPFTLLWFVLDVRMSLSSSSSGSSSYWLHVFSLSSLALECVLLKARYPECWLPDYFQSFRSHPITHLCAAACTIGLVAAFIIDKNTLSNKLECDWPVTLLSIFNMMLCSWMALKTVLKILNAQKLDNKI